jgi:hypothetical protein
VTVARHDLETALYAVFSPGKCWRIDPKTKGPTTIEWEGARSELAALLGPDYPRPRCIDNGIMIDGHMAIVWRDGGFVGIPESKLPVIRGRLTFLG